MLYYEDLYLYILVTVLVLNLVTFKLRDTGVVTLPSQMCDYMITHVSFDYLAEVLPICVMRPSYHFHVHLLDLLCILVHFG